MSTLVCELPKNNREVYQFRLAEYKGFKYADLRLFVIEPGENGGELKVSPTKKGLTVSPQLWPQFRRALAQIEEAMIQERWLDSEDLAPQM